MGVSIWEGSKAGEVVDGLEAVADAIKETITVQAYGMNVVEDTTSTAITLAAEAETRYIYGELTSLTISSLPSQGLVDILFESGSTATTLSVPNDVILPSWFSVSADTIVEISILDGVYGSVQTWAS